MKTTDYENASIEALIQAIQMLPEDKPVRNPNTWYCTQKEHWLFWLREYRGPGAYGRKIKKLRNAAYVYNHIGEYRMLLYLAKAAGVDRKLLKSAEGAAKVKCFRAKSKAIRTKIPWSVIAVILFK